MKKLLIASIAIIIIAVIPVAMILCTMNSVAEGWEGGAVIELKNTSQYIKVARVFWVDHPFRDKWLRPMPMCVGEIEAGESFVIGESDKGYSPGIYVFSWELCYRLYHDRPLERVEEEIIIQPNVSRITVTDRFNILTEEEM